MRLFNRLLATIISLALIFGSAIGTLYLIGVLARLPSLTSPIRRLFTPLLALSASQIGALLLAVSLLALVLLILEIRPFRARFVLVRDDSQGMTQISRPDIERCLSQRLSKLRAITSEGVDILVHGKQFDVSANIAVSSQADLSQVRAQVEENIKANLESIGVGKGLRQISTRISRFKRAA